jgi:hypothetical protein
MSGPLYGRRLGIRSPLRCAELRPLAPSGDALRLGMMRLCPLRLSLAAVHE